MKPLKRVVAIHDISGVGKCSLTVALPIISAAGVECSVMPTAVLSTHTGGFSDFTFRDLTDDMMPIAKHWKKEQIEFDAIYTGYLGSVAQIELICEIFDMFKSEKTMTLVDPAMADDGKLYSLFTQEMVTGMAKLCGKADIIIPNRTEAAFMLGKEYKGGVMTKEEADGLLRELATLGAKKIILTGVFFEEDDLGAGCYDVEKDEIFYVMGKRIEGQYHGSGDVFASFFLGAYMQDLSLEKALEAAVEYTCKAIDITKKDDSAHRMGLRFESVLGDYNKSLDN